MKYCQNCGAENSDTSRFCRECGKNLETLENENKSTGISKNNKIIIIAMIAIVAILAIGVLFAGGVFKSNVPLENMDFGVFTMDVPVGANFEEFASMPNYGIGGFIFLENTGKYSKEVGMLEVSNMQYFTSGDEFSFDSKEGDITIFKDNTGETNLLLVVKEIDEYDFAIMGEDKDTMIKMLNSIVITDSDGLSSQSSGQTSSSAPASSSTPSSISILGGSFSTGSADEDKTYARINVGTSHAGEDVIVQIYYSRDGNRLNNGNMVPATVHSDGYLEIASADAYKYYPDYATINIYDTNNNLLATRSVSLMPAAGTQTF